MHVLGLDVGGAGIKAADDSGWAASRRFPLWQSPERLSTELMTLLDGRPYARIALTMTGELCDCFETRADGVAAIIAAVQNAFPNSSIAVFQTTGDFASPASAIASPWATGAANWRALAEWCAAKFPGRGLLIDIGSTTTDIIHIDHGLAVPQGTTDPDRLASGELVYQGVERTPICALLSDVRINGVNYRTMAELFATTIDAYLVLGAVADDESLRTTADGRPATRKWACERLARMIGSDRTRFSENDAIAFARQVESRQIETVGAGVNQVIATIRSPIDFVVVSGQGEFFARRVVNANEQLCGAQIHSLAAELGPEISRAACAYTVAVLLKTRSDNSTAIPGDAATGR